MEEFKGTPGPWLVKTIHGDLKVIQKGSYEKLAPGMVSYRCVTELENKHDAKLIAAAPELLEALQDALHAYDKHGEHSEWDFARAAIAKALGK
jgi:hypothetical protein